MSELYSFTFTPHFKERVWGGRNIERLYGKPLPPGQVIGESWEITDWIDSSRWPMHAHFDVGHEDEAALPIFHRFGGKHLPDAPREGEPSRRSQTHQHQAVMGARSELAQV